MKKGKKCCEEVSMCCGNKSRWCFFVWLVMVFIIGMLVCCLINHCNHFGGAAKIQAASEPKLEVKAEKPKVTKFRKVEKPVY